MNDSMNRPTIIRQALTRFSSAVLRAGRRPAVLGAALLLGSSASVLATQNTPVTITAATVVPTQINEGETVTLSAQFADPDLTDGHSVYVMWGVDGRDWKWRLPIGQRSFQIQHTFEDDKNPYGQLNNSVHFTIIDHQLPFGANDNTSGKTFDREYLPITVKNVAPAFVQRGLNVTKQPVKGGSGAMVVVEGDVVDPGTKDVLQVTASWNDPASPNQTSACTMSNNTRHFVCEHVYPASIRAETLRISLAVKDDDGGQGVYQVGVPTSQATR